MVAATVAVSPTKALGTFGYAPNHPAVNRMSA
jgi:hypothetical protein